jgi:hypothetical protein
MTELLVGIAAVLAALLGFFVGKPIGHKQGKREERQANAERTLNRFMDGQDALRNSSGAPDDRVRANDGKWQ